MSLSHRRDPSESLRQKHFIIFSSSFLTLRRITARFFFFFFYKMAPIKKSRWVLIFFRAGEKRFPKSFPTFPYSLLVFKLSRSYSKVLQSATCLQKDYFSRLRFICIRFCFLEMFYPQHFRFRFGCFPICIQNH